MAVRVGGRWVQSHAATAVRMLLSSAKFRRVTRSSDLELAAVLGESLGS